MIRPSSWGVATLLALTLTASLLVLAGPVLAAVGFTPAVNHSVGANGPNSVAKADFNSDGKLDVATANVYEFDSKDVSILLGNGDGSFGVATTISVARDTQSVTSADFNGDGKADLVHVQTRW